MSVRLTPKDRKAEILEAAYLTAQKVGFAKMRQADVAARAGCSHGTVTLRWDGMAKLRAAVMRRAIADECLAVVAAGLGIGDPVARKAPAALKEKAIQTLSA